MMSRKLLAVALLSLLVTDPAQAKKKSVIPRNAALTVCQDEGSLETVLARYISQNYDVNAETGASEQDPSDIYLYYNLGSDRTIRAVVDTAVTGRLGTDVTSRSVFLRAFLVLPAEAKTPEARAAILEYNNEWMVRYWLPGRVYLDGDGDVVLETHYNLPRADVALHAEVVYDQLERLASSWITYADGLRTQLGLVDPLP